MKPRFERSYGSRTRMVNKLAKEYLTDSLFAAGAEDSHRGAVNLWKLKGSVGKLLGNTVTDSPSHYQRLKCWLSFGAKNKLLWRGLLKSPAALLVKNS
ncbi:hypothetical protein [Cesiribacter sp. SM1]|uniref:hypothetical protein n=1 Tax=Cesiribacter sp. SM1 TaxID=2861196 RepID=UPI001CD5150A|nr:hypothetical protein [Cesiribacter sp. SM1]